VYYYHYYYFYYYYCYYYYYYYDDDDDELTACGWKQYPTTTTTTTTIRNSQLHPARSTTIVPLPLRTTSDNDIGSNRSTVNAHSLTLSFSSSSFCSSSFLFFLLLLQGDSGELEVVVAVQQGNILATAFHPELLTDDHAWHDYFLDMIVKGLIAPTTSTTA